MAPDSQGMPDRICSLSGPEDAVNRAKELINGILHQRGRNEGLEGAGPPMGSNNGYSGGDFIPNIGSIFFPFDLFPSIVLAWYFHRMVHGVDAH